MSIVVNGMWSNWGEWGECSTTCGDGSRSRNRTCNNPAPANGGNDCDSQKTNTEACEEPPACPGSVFLYLYITNVF